MTAAKPPILTQLFILAVIVIPLIAVLCTPFFIWGWGFGWTYLALLLSMYVLTSLGITVGFHRLFVHRSFKTYTWVKFIFAILGSMALQGSLFKWVGIHRRHHQYSDTIDDPHSPLRGFWHAHMGWFFDADPVIEKYIIDLKASAALRVADRLFVLWVVLGMLLPALVGAAITCSWSGFFGGLVWGGLVRLFLVHHVTWSINSACHMWGMRPYNTTDKSKNNIIFGFLGMGEGWHNTHHAFPTSARHGLRWWQLDISYYVIRLLTLVGLAWNVKGVKTVV